MKRKDKTLSRPTIGTPQQLRPFVAEGAGKNADPSWKYVRLAGRTQPCRRFQFRIWLAACRKQHDIKTRR